jgi:hypothetical protein
MIATKVVKSSRFVTIPSESSTTLFKSTKFYQNKI